MLKRKPPGGSRNIGDPTELHAHTVRLGLVREDLNLLSLRVVDNGTALELHADFLAEAGGEFVGRRQAERRRVVARRPFLGDASHQSVRTGVLGTEHDAVLEELVDDAGGFIRTANSQTQRWAEGIKDCRPRLLQALVLAQGQHFGHDARDLLHRQAIDRLIRVNLLVRAGIHDGEERASQAD